MIQIDFSTSEQSELFKEKESNPHSRIRKKAEVLYLKSLNFRHKKIMEITQISRPTLSSYLKRYKVDRLGFIRELNFYKQKSDLDEYIPDLRAYFEEHPPQNNAEAQAIIKARTSLKRSPTQIRAFLKRMGMKLRKTGMYQVNLVKKKCLYSKYYSNFTEFKNEIRNTLANLEDYKEETQTLLTLNFQTFKNVKTITV